MEDKDFENKIKKIDEQIANLLEERLEIARRKGDFELSFKDKMDNKIITGFLDIILEEFKKKASKYKLKYIVASGPIIIEEGNLLVNKDEKDDFYKLPGGTVEEDEVSLESACHRETKEENNAEIEIIRPSHPMLIWKNPQTGEKMAILLIHYKAKLLNKEDIKPIPPVKEVTWLDVEEIKQGKHNVAPNIKFLIEKGEI
jgi:ADP-ribose pyrophosphatase YjhB (NUDIX family)